MFARVRAQNKLLECEVPQVTPFHYWYHTKYIVEHFDTSYWTPWYVTSCLALQNISPHRFAFEIISVEEDTISFSPTTKNKTEIIDYRLWMRNRPPISRLSWSLLVLTGCTGVGGTPLYGLPVYSYVQPQRVWFFSRFGHKLGIDFSHFGNK